MSSKVTIVEIAKMANVSTATVSRVINNSGRVDEAKRQRILELIDQYNYKSNYIAKALQSSKSNLVGFVVPHINSPYFAQVFFEAEIIAQKLGLTLMLCNSEGKCDVESKILDTLVSTNVRAIVFMGGRLDDARCDEKYLKEIEKINKSIPVISCVQVPELECTQIYEDQVDSSRKLLKHLADQGYTDIALVGGLPDVRTTTQRRNDILDNAAAFGISVREEIVECGYSIESGYIGLQEVLKWKKRPQAVVCVNDLVAIGALSEVQKNKLSVPDDIAIVGYDNMEMSEFIYPGITTISTDYKAYAQAIVDTVRDIYEIEGNLRISTPRDLIIRGTTQKM